MKGRKKKSRKKAGLVSSGLLKDVRTLIDNARESVASAVNTGLVGSYWQIGKRLRREVLKEQRAGYGERIVSALGRQLSLEYGPGFSEKNLWHMVRFAESFSNPQIVYALSRQLGWTHFRSLIYLKDPLQRDFYAEMCRIEKWSTRTLDNKIQAMLFERTAISKKPEKLVRRELAALRKEDQITPDMVFRDPYFLNFLNLADTYSEKDIESAILREMEKFILELGVGFSFLARQKRITIDEVDYYLDLLFFHRKLKRLVAIDLKLGRFQASDKGQMELYLRWLDRHEREEGENSPLGLILCAGKSDEHIEFLQLAKSGIRVAEYITELPAREILTEKLHKAIKLARQRLPENRHPRRPQTKLPKALPA
jgi:predicted nuclease of restriction endonuclease-like (RecB) superfamily